MNKIGTKTIETERLTLRPFTKGDVQEVYENYGKDVKISKYISWIPCNTLEKCEQFINFNLKEYDSNPLFFSWTIIFEEDIVGSIAIFNVDENSESGELGYSLGSKWWNKGLMTEAGKSVLNYAFNDVKFHRIFATFHEDNIASKKVLEKLSMKYEGKLKDGQKNLDGTFSNLDLYAILDYEFDDEN
jgi:ribosomal-protein-alanine N-acetyltransferase